MDLFLSKYSVYSDTDAADIYIVIFEQFANIIRRVCEFDISQQSVQYNMNLRIHSKPIHMKRISYAYCHAMLLYILNLGHINNFRRRSL